MARVQLFVTCLVDGFAPEVGRATVSLLERLGDQVDFAVDQACCGQPAFNAGHVRDARAMAAQTVRVLDSTKGPIVVPSGSCADMLVHHSPHLLEGEPEASAAVRVAGRVRELTQYLVDDRGQSDVGASCDGCAVAFHSSCHGRRNLHIDEEPEALLATVSGIDRRFQAEPEQCCGFGGLFAVEMPAISAAILDAKLDALEACGADVVVGGDVSCLLHIEGGLRRRNSTMKVMHIAELLAGED